jgi:hypothetical protein
MGMSVNEDIRFRLPDEIKRLGAVSSRSSCNVCHGHGNSFYLKVQVFREFGSDRLIIDIPENGPQRFECFQAVGNVQASDIAGMPDLIHVFE